MMGIIKSEIHDSTISLDEWLKFNSNNDERRKLFIGMSLALKYIHENDYYVLSFNPNDIDILNGSYNKIRFNEIDRMPNDYSLKRELVKSNIFKQAFFQIGIYTDCLPYLKEDFLKSSFNEFTVFLPDTDIAYYRGVVQRGASVYLSDFCVELQKREFSSLENELSSASGGLSGGRSLVKSNGQSILSDNSYDSIYNLNKKSDAAFVSFLIIPALVSILGVIFTILAWIASIF